MSPRKSRKSLDDVLARQFIYGEKQHETLEEATQKQGPSEPSPEPFSSPDSESVTAQSAVGMLLGATEKISSELPLMDKFQTPPKEATIRFTVDLPASMHRKLSILAARTGKKKAEIVRVLLDEALEGVGE
jgi:hypothetical protein